MRVRGEGAQDDGADDRGTGQHGQPPDPPDHRQPKRATRDRDDHSQGRVARHVHILVGVGLGIGRPLGLLEGKGVQRPDAGDGPEIVGRRRRAGRPFQAAPVPWIAQRAGQRRAVARAGPEGVDQACQRRDQDRGAAESQPHRGLKGGVVIAGRPPGHSHQSQPVQRQECKAEPRHPQKRGAPRQLFVQAKAEGLGEPVMNPCEHAEQRARDQNVVEMRDHELGIVQLIVDRRIGQDHPGQPAEDEKDEEPRQIDDRHRDPHPAAKQRRHPVIDLHAGGHRDDHGGDAEGGVDAAILSHGEEMVQPDRERDHRDGHRRDHQAVIAIKPLGREGGRDLGIDAEGRQHDDIDLGVAEHPEDVGVLHHVSAQVVGEEMKPRHTVQRQHRGRCRDRREGIDHHDRGAERGPGEHRHPQEGHARRTQLVDRHRDVHPGEGRADPGKADRPDPVVHPRAGAEGGAGEGRIHRPATGPELTQDQRQHDQSRPRRRQPQRDLVQHRERHVPRPDLQGDGKVDQPRHQRRRHEEDHDRSVGREELCIMVGRQDSAVQRADLMGAHHRAFQHAAQKHHPGQHHIHDADPLVVRAGQPVPPKRSPQMVARQQPQCRRRAQHHGQRGTRGHGLVEGRIAQEVVEWRGRPVKAPERCAHHHPPPA